MIFVTVGNDFRDFSRLIKRVDEITPHLSHEVIIQKGYSRYRPKNTRHFDFVPIDAAVEYIRSSALVISHAGIGTIILCRRYAVPIIIFPRRKKYGEHMNDHQMEIAKALEERGDQNIYVIYEQDRLEEKIWKVLNIGRKNVLFENSGKMNLIRIIREFIRAT